MATGIILDDFQAKVDSFVGKALSEYDPERHATEKSIRDAVWGMCRFHRWEVAIIDSPLLQRLRDIRQTGLAYLVYPTAEHSRFDHTLGVVTVASRIVRSINDKYSGNKDPKVSYHAHMCVRLSALLHDVGHSCFSHVSETVLGATPEFKALIGKVNELLGIAPKPHEIMSWLVVRSKPFREFMRQLVDRKIIEGWDFSVDGDIDVIAGYILGYGRIAGEKFLADIINGPMDADKLDYLVRDAYFAGPTVVYDLERFLHTVDAIDYPKGPNVQSEGEKLVRLSVPISGVTALEQIIISKLMLFSYLYHHHKIRCVEGMYQEAMRTWVQAAKKASSKRVVASLDHADLWLGSSDRSILPGLWPSKKHEGKVSAEIRSMLARRELYRRALVISRLFIRNIDDDQAKRGFGKLLACATKPIDREELRVQIFKKTRAVMKSPEYSRDTRDLRKKFKLHHLLLDIPVSPSVEETRAVMIPVRRGSQRSREEYVPLADVFPIEKWVDAYNALKWRGHVFALEDATFYVSIAARKVLSEEPYWIQFTEEATELCKIDAPKRKVDSLFPEE